jgi:hypothetical protein
MTTVPNRDVALPFQGAMNELDSLTTEFKNCARKEFTQYLGDDVGNAVANEFTAGLDFSEGGVKSVLGTVGSLGELVAHPQDLAKLVAEENPIAQAMTFAHDPRGFLDQKLDMAKGLVDAKDWTSDHPLRGAGYVGDTIAQFLIPGAGEAKAGTEAAAAADEAAQAARAETQAARGGEGILGVGAESGIAAKGPALPEISTRSTSSPARLQPPLRRCDHPSPPRRQGQPSRHRPKRLERVPGRRRPWATADRCPFRSPHQRRPAGRAGWR